MEKFALGLAIGGIAGALLVANNYKMRTFVKKTQEELQSKFDQILDEKIDAVSEKTDEIEDKITEGVSKAAKKVKKTVKQMKKSATE